MKEDKTFHLHKSKSCCNRKSRKFYNEEMLKVFLPKHFMIILKRGKENMLPYYIFGSMEMCSREVEVGAFYLLGVLST